MKSKLLLFALITFFMLTNLAFAGSPFHSFGSKNSTDIELNHPVTVAGTALPAGQYKVSWQGTGPEVNVSFSRGRNTVTVPARLTDGNGRVYVGNPYPALITSDSPDRTHVLLAIDLKNLSIEFGEFPTAQEN